MILKRLDQFRSWNKLPLFLVTLVGLIIVLWHYASYPGTPGNNETYPLGWWGWFDQGEYIKASRDFMDFHVTPEAHRYPPLYPLMGALFLPLSELHSYLPVNLILFTVYILAFMAAFGPYVGRWLAVASAVLGLFQFKILMLQWAIPWTSSLAACLQMLALLLFQRYLARRNDVSWQLPARLRNALLSGLALGLLAPTRPVDLVAFSPLLLTYAGMVLFERQIRWRNRLLVLLVGVVATALPVLAYLGFNAVFFGDPMGGYFEAIEGSGGAALADFFDRTYSHLLDANAFYAEERADWKTRLPLLLIFLCFVPFALFFATPFLRVVAACVLFHFWLVYSFADAVPTGQFRYFNIHYFKWMFPVLPIFFFHFSRLVWVGIKPSSNKSSGYPMTGAIFGIFGGLALTLIFAAIDPVYQTYDAASVSALDQKTLSIQFDNFVHVDFVDLTIPTAGIGSFSVLAQKVSINNGEMLRQITDIRLTPRAGGMRAIFTDTTYIENMRIEVVDIPVLDPNTPPEAFAGQVKFQLRAPWASEPEIPEFNPPTAKTDTVYEAGDPSPEIRFFGEGWSSVEHWRRWMDGKTAQLQFVLPAEGSKDAQLYIEGQSFLPKEGSSFTLQVWVNGTLAQETIILSQDAQSIAVPMNEHMQANSRRVDIELRVSDTLSPQDAGLSSDDRELSFGLRRFRIGRSVIGSGDVQD